MSIKHRTEAKGLIVSTAKDEKAESVYENYYEFSEPVSKIAGHRVLALNRGEKEKFLNVKIEAPTEEILRYLEKKIITKENPQTKPVLQATIEDAYNRLIAPAIDDVIISFFVNGPSYEILPLKIYSISATTLSLKAASTASSMSLSTGELSFG